jgi:carboxyl-terminal processing protease
VQNVEALRGGYGIKLTIARYYTPNDRSIQAKGIEPDIVVEFKRPGEKGKKKRPSHLKEKDLRNHLEAEPPPKAKKEKKGVEKPSGKSGKKEKKKDLTDGTLSMKRLRSDNQITRALDVLVSFDIFGHIQK